MLKTIEEQLAELKAMSEHDIDTSDIPKSGHLNWDTAETGKFFRPNKSVANVGCISVASYTLNDKK